MKHQLLTLLLMITLTISTSSTAIAASADDVESSIPGCNSSIKNIIRNYAEVKVAYEAAVIDEMLSKPYSALKMICFKDSLSKTAESSSQIFSGPFFESIEGYVDQTLEAHFANFNDDLVGVPNEEGQCIEIGNIVSENDTDLIREVPSFENALAEEYGNTGDKFKNSWQVVIDSGVAANYDEAWARLYNSYESSALEFDEADTPCDVLSKSGLVGVECDEEELGSEDVAVRTKEDGSDGEGTTPTTVTADDRNRRPLGVRPSIQRAMIYDVELRKAFDYSIENSFINKPSGLAALTCFAAAAEIHAKSSGELFSKDYSNQVLDPINDGLDAIKDAYSFDNIVDYNASIQASAGLDASLSIVPSDGNDSGPTVKGLECGQMQNKWMTSRDRGVKNNLTYKELLGGGTGEDENFNNSWNNSSDNLSRRMRERERLTGRETTREVLFEGPDIPFNDREDFCKILAALNLKGDCQEGEFNIAK